MDSLSTSSCSDVTVPAAVPTPQQPLTSAANICRYKGATPLSPASHRYHIKRYHLQQKYDYIYTSNNRLRNRLYHIKKEINHLKRLKRVLCQRLFTFRDPFMDSCLEIPDNEPTTPAIDKAPNEASGRPFVNPRKRKAPGNRQVVNQQASEVSSMAEIAKNSVKSIIDSVITESHEERVRANQNSGGGQKVAAQQSGPSVPRICATTRRRRRETAEVHKDEPMINRMLDTPPVGNLMAVDPESDPNNILTGFGENLEENFMEED